MQKRSLFLSTLAFLIVVLCFAVPWGRQDLIFQLLSQIEELGSCTSCLGLLIPLQALARIGDDALTEALVSLCSGLGIQSEDVCVGALGSQGPIVAHVLRSISIQQRTASLLCAKVLGLCPYPAVPHYTFPLQKPKRNASVPLSGKKQPLKFVHVTDIHVDQYYMPGSEARCFGPICCRGPIEGVPRMAAGPYGNYRCDSPVILFESMLEAIKKYASDAEALIFTGDAIDHAVWLSTQKEVTSSVSLAYEKFNTLPMPIYGAIGNHDVHPTNSFPRATSPYANISDWTFELHEKYWRPSIGKKTAKESTHQSGSFSIVHPGTNLKVISFNSNYCYKANFWMYDSNDYHPDSNGLLRWLADELQDAEDAGQRAWIIAHMSSGKSDFMQDQSAIFDQIVQRYHKTLSLQLYGHSHTAEFEIGYSTYAQRDASTATSISLIAPALTPSSGNPAFRILEVDPDSFELMDYIELIANVTSPSYQKSPEWLPYYSARESYGRYLFDRPLAAHEPLNPAFWHRMTDIFESNDEAFMLFMRHRTRDAIRPRCSTPFCKARWIAALRAARSEYNGQAHDMRRPFARRTEPVPQQVFSPLEDSHTSHPDEEEDQPGDHACSSRVEDTAKMLQMIARMPDSKDRVRQMWKRVHAKSKRRRHPWHF